MVRVLFIFIAAVLFKVGSIYSQTFEDSLQGFDANDAIEHIHEHNIYDSIEVEHYLELSKQRYINKKYELGFYAPPIPTNTPNNRAAGDCDNDNWGFENGDFSGWTKSGNVQIVNSSSTDPYGGFPWSYNGSKAAKICSDKSAGGIHGKLEKSINVASTGTTLFTFHFAMAIFNFPHSSGDAAKFYVDFYDGNGNKLPCPQYECYYSTNNGVVGVANMQQTANNATFYNSSAEGAGQYNVTYAEWNSITMDLSGYAGQTITAVFKVDWCVYNVDWAYALVDVDCPIVPEDTQMLCGDVTGTTEICTVPDMQSYTWRDDGGNIIGNNQCVNVTSAGEYTVETVPQNIACSNAPTITYNYKITPNPVLDFDLDKNKICDGEEIKFTNNTTVPTGGTIGTYQWYYGDGIKTPQGYGAISGVNQTTGDYESTNTHQFNTLGDHEIKLVAITDDGCSDTITKTITVFPFPTADFTVDSVCQGTAITLQDGSTINSSGGDYIDSWAWDFGDGQMGTSANPTHLYDNEDLYDIKLIVMSDVGCADSIVKTTAIYPNPEPDFSPTEVCLEAATQFTDESTVSNNHTSNTILSWEWNFDDGNTDNLQNPTNTYLNEGLYNVTLEVTTNHGCSAIDSIIVTVYPNPVINFTVPKVCLLSLTEFDDASTVSNTYTSNQITDWAWDFGDGNTSNVQDPSHTYAIDSIYTAVLTVTTNHSCSAIDSLPVTVFPNPNADFIIDSICQGANSVFQDLSSINTYNSDQIINWTWDFGDGQSSSSQNPTHLYGSENLYHVQLVVESNNGCFDSITKVTAIYPNPVVDFSPTEVCLEFDTHFLDASTVSNDHTPNHNVDWVWDFADGDSAFVKNPIHTYQTDGIFNAILTVTTNHNCTSTETIPVTVYPKPVASFTGINLEGCAPVCPTVNSTSTINNPSSIVNYEWTLSDGTVYEGSEPYFTECYDNETGDDIYYGLLLTVTSDKGCVGFHSEPNYISVYHNPVASFYTTPDAPDVIDPTVEFHNTSLYANYYNWTIGYYGQTGEKNPIVDFPPDSASYPAELIAYTDKGCTDTARTVVKILDRLIFYVPNTFTPDNDDFNEMFSPVFTSGFDPQTYTLYIFNRWGQLIFESHDTNVGWNGTFGTNSSKTVRDGTYIWKIDFKTSMNDEHKTYTGHVNVLK